MKRQNMEMSPDEQQRAQPEAEAQPLRFEPVPLARLPSLRLRGSRLLSSAGSPLQSRRAPQLGMVVFLSFFSSFRCFFSSI